MNWYKESASPKKIISDLQIEDPIMQYFLVNIGKNILNFKGISSKEELNASVNQKYLELKASALDKMLVSPKFVEKSMSAFQNNPQSQYHGLSAEVILDRINGNKKATLFGGKDPETDLEVFGWVEEIESDPEFNPAFAYMTLSHVIKSSGKKTRNAPPPVNAEALVETKSLMKDYQTSAEAEDAQGEATFSFTSLFNSAIKNVKNKEEGMAPRKSGWTLFEQKSDPKELAGFTSSGGWCLSGCEITCKRYLDRGDVYIFSEQGKPRVALALEGVNSIYEVRAAGNKDAIIHGEEVINFIKSKGILISQYDMGAKSIVKAMSLNSKIEDDPENPKNIDLAERNPQFILGNNKKGKYLDIYFNYWTQKVYDLGLEDWDSIPEDVIKTERFQKSVIPQYFIPIAIQKYHEGPRKFKEYFPNFLQNRKEIIDLYEKEINISLDSFSRIPDILVNKFKTLVLEEALKFDVMLERYFYWPDVASAFPEYEKMYKDQLLEVAYSEAEKVLDPDQETNDDGFKTIRESIDQFSSGDNTDFLISLKEILSDAISRAKDYSTLRNDNNSLLTLMSPWLFYGKEDVELAEKFNEELKNEIKEKIPNLIGNDYKETGTLFTIILYNAARFIHKNRKEEKWEVDKEYLNKLVQVTYDNVKRNLIFNIEKYLPYSSNKN